MRGLMKSLIVGLAVSVAGASLAGAVELKVGVSAEPYPPFASPDASGHWQGWEIEIIEAICQSQELDCVITPVAWDGIIPLLNTGRIDMIVSSMSITPQRLEMIDFSNKYYETQSLVVGSTSLEFEATPDGLADKIIGVQSSTRHQSYALKYFAPAGATVKEYLTQDEANSDLVSGRIDAVEADDLALREFLSTDAGKACCNEKGVVAPDVDILGPGIGIGLRKGDAELKGKLNAGIEAIRANGVYQQISQRYFDFDIYGQ